MTTPRPAGQASAERCVYWLEGTVIEAVGGTPSSGRHSGAWVTTWVVGRGEIAGTDVSRLVIIGVRRDGSDATSKAAVLLLDERATPQQVQVVRDAFEGRHGGPLTGVFAGSRQPPGFYLVPVELCLAATGPRSWPGTW